MINSETIQGLLNSARQQLPGSDTASLDAELLLQSVLNCERSYFFSHPEESISNDAVASFNKLIEQRSKGIPVAYLLGEREFWSIKLKVTENTLIPRPETELLVEQAMQLLPENEPRTVLDLGTGTGAIALSIAKERPRTKVTATDICADTLDVAKDNAHRNNIDNVKFKQSDWYSNLKRQQYDLVISNPPYIAEDDQHLEQGDVRFEPRQALSSGPDGFDDLKILIKESMHFLNDNGILLLEHGYQQGEAVTQLLKSLHYKKVQALYDLSGHHRASKAEKADRQ